MSGIRWGKRKLEIIKDEKNSGVGFLMGGFPITFSVWGKTWAVELGEGIIFPDEVSE